MRKAHWPGWLRSPARDRSASMPKDGKPHLPSRWWCNTGPRKVRPTRCAVIGCWWCFNRRPFRPRKKPAPKELAVRGLPGRPHRPVRRPLQLPKTPLPTVPGQPAVFLRPVPATSLLPRQRLGQPARKTQVILFGRRLLLLVRRNLPLPNKVTKVPHRFPGWCRSVWRPLASR